MLVWIICSLGVARSLLAQEPFAGRYRGTVIAQFGSGGGGPSGITDAGGYTAIVEADGNIQVSVLNGNLTGTVAPTGEVTFTGGSVFATMGIRRATIALEEGASDYRLSSVYGDVVNSNQYRLAPATRFPFFGPFVNGSFEGGPSPGSSSVTLNTSATSIHGWTVVTGSVDYVGSGWQASEGARSLDLSGDAAGEIAQTFATNPGERYVVIFDYAGNPGYGIGAGLKRMRVSVNNAANTAQDYTFDTTGRTFADLGWVRETFTFTASAAATTLRFASRNDDVFGPVLDNVKVNGATGAITLPDEPVFPPRGAPPAPATLVGYRNRVNQTFELTLTGARGGAIWGTDVYSDNSDVATAAVHAGVIEPGRTEIVAVTVLPGQANYEGSSRNDINSGSSGAAGGSFAFPRAGRLGSTLSVTALPYRAPAFTPGALSVSAGSRLLIPVAAGGGGSMFYDWYLNNARIQGAAGSPHVIDAATASDAGTYSVDVRNWAGTTRITAATVTVHPSGTPAVTLHPVGKTVAPGTAFTLAVSAEGAGNTFQWLRNNVALAGETKSALRRPNASAADAGAYTVRIANAAGSVTSNPAVVSVSPDASRPANISCRTFLGAGQSVTPGFVVQGTGSKRVLVRAVGPGLGAFGLSGTMPDPRLEVYRGTTRIAEADDWEASLSSAFSAVGAFPLGAGSKDAAILATLPAGPAENYTVRVSGAGSSAGLVLIELYDADPADTMTSRLVNVSVRGQAGADANRLILGFVLHGSGRRTLLIRGIGPQLAVFGVAGTLADPKLEIFDGSAPPRRMLVNEDWHRTDYLGELLLAANSVGAFALDQRSKDSSTLAFLDPGAYSVQISGADGGTGEALVEVYEVP